MRRANRSETIRGVDTTVKDARRIVAALIFAWPEQLDALQGTQPKEAREASCLLAGLFMQELLAELSAGRSREWTPDDMEIRVFRMVDEERLGATSFINDAGKGEGALIVAGAKSLLIGTHPADV